MTNSLSWAYSEEDGLTQFGGDLPEEHRLVPEPPEGDLALLRFRPAGNGLPDRWEAFTPPVPVPQSVPMHAAKITLRRHGHLAAAEAAAQAAGGDTLIAWQSAPSISRVSPTMKGIQAVLGLSDAEVDALFIAAAKLNV